MISFLDPIAAVVITDASTFAPTTKAKSRSTACKDLALNGGRVVFEFRGVGILSSRMVKPTVGPFISKELKIFGCSSPNIPMVFFGPRQIRPCRPGCQWDSAPRKIWNLDGAPIKDKIFSMWHLTSKTSTSLSCPCTSFEAVCPISTPLRLFC